MPLKSTTSGLGDSTDQSFGEVKDKSRLVKIITDRFFLLQQTALNETTALPPLGVASGCAMTIRL
jgi:hypothetical protein